jgi:hypothetical protein
MSGTQTPADAGVESTVALSQTNKVHCKTCGRGFGRERNLRIHEAVHDEHAAQDTTEAIAKRLKYNTDHNTSRRTLRTNDPIYREKQRQISMTNRIKKKASEADKENHVEPKDVSIQVDDESNDISSEDTLSEDALLHEDGGGAIQVDDESNDISSEDTLSEDTLLHEDGGGAIQVDDESNDISNEATLLHEDGGGTSRHVKKTHRDDAGKGVFRVTTTALTNQNVQAFFAPKWSAPRSKEQRKIAPRPSAI